MIDHELWQAVASGLLNSAVAQGVAITHRDSRRVLHGTQDMVAWLRVESFEAIGYIVSDVTVGLLWNEIEGDFVRDPQIREQAIPMVAEARVEGDRLAADDPGEYFKVFVFAWDFVEFSEVGDLEAHSRPGKGTFVLASRNEAGEFGLPSAFLTLTA